MPSSDDSVRSGGQLDAVRVHVAGCPPTLVNTILLLSALTRPWYTALCWWNVTTFPDRASDPAGAVLYGQTRPLSMHRPAELGGPVAVEVDHAPALDGPPRADPRQRGGHALAGISARWCGLSADHPDPVLSHPSPTAWSA